MIKAYLALGSNLGNRKENILKAYQYIQADEDVAIIAKSSFYETKPVGYVDQEWFINSVIAIETTLTPYELLELCHNVENELKRVRKIRWGPRTIDVDILLYNDLTLDEEDLIIPHPRMTERAFVIVPLYEIDQSLTINNKSIKLLKDQLDTKDVKKIHE